jgi:hypothetical protein
MDENAAFERAEMLELRKSLSKLLKQLFLRHNQREFCAAADWISVEVCDVVRGVAVMFLSAEDYADSDGVDIEVTTLPFTSEHNRFACLLANSLVLKHRSTKNDTLLNVANM